ncbi:2-oxoglutarate receptor 1-like isoform X2 [Oryzias melastigma]|nr:2-oxoglutarate receptor 1-like isoform X2 [Oryzias melastigma]
MTGFNYSCTDVEELMKRYYLPVSYSLIFIVGLVGNTISICIYLTKMRPWKSSSIIMVNLALTDLLYVVTMPFLVYYYSTDSWMLGDFMCRFVRFAFHFHLYASILFLTCLSVFRYIVVMKPLLAVHVQQTFWGVVACSAVWTITAAQTSPILTFISLRKDQNKTNCLDFASTDPVTTVREYSWVLTALGFVLPLMVVFICNIGIVRKLAEGPNPSVSHRTRAQNLIILIVVVFAVCFLPYHILRVLWVEIQYNAKTHTTTTTTCCSHIIQAAYIVSRPLAAVNTFFNLGLYTLTGNKFRRAFKSVFRWECWLVKVRAVLHQIIINKGGTGIAAA